MLNKITLVYFSATGNTEKSIVAMAEGNCKTIEKIDLTCGGAAVEFDENDFVILGAPVYAGRIPSVAAERFSKIKGNNTPCIVVVSYGNREFDDALLEMADMLSAQGFVIKGAAGVIGRHTYGEIQVDRPDATDLSECRAFGAEAAASGKAWPQFDIPGNRPYRAGMERGNWQPLTNDSCVKCGICVKACPVQAIAEDCIDIGEECISCFRCIRNCPMAAKHMDTEAYNKFAADFTEKLKVRKENKFFL